MMNEFDLDKSRWALNAMSRAVKAMHHSSNDSELCQSCCDAITADAAYPLAWIGFALNDEKHSIKIAAKSGQDVTYLDGIQVTWADEPSGRGAAGTAVKTGKTQVIDNTHLNPALDPWKERVSSAGFNSAIAIPIIVGSECVGALLVYSYQPGAFDEHAVRQLENLAEVIGFGVILYRTTSAMLNERQKAMELKEEQLRTLQLLNTISNSSTDAIFAKDSLGRYLLFNREGLREIGKSLEEVIGKGAEEIYAPEEAVKIKARDSSIMCSGQPVTFEEMLTTVDGVRTFLTTKGPLHDSDANIIGLFGISRDITERKNSELAIIDSMRKMEEKELAKTRFLAAAGHDLRQPVAAANLFVDALKSTSPTQRQSELINRLDQSMSIFSSMLERLLHISKFDAGMVKLQIASFSLVELLTWLNQNFSQAALDKQLRFRLFFPMNQSLVVHTDISLVQSVLMNLVSNAIKFTVSGSILVSARLRGDNVLVQVWDTGIGIDDAELPNIFDEFYQVDNPQRSREAGLGLGLSICQRAMSLLDGKISCRSRPGRGSVFEFSLPLNGEQHELKPLPVNNTPSVITNEMLFKGKAVVVVEDDAMVAQAMVYLVEGMGGKVKCFPSAEDALQHDYIEYADYYIADFMLGGTLNGMQFLNQLRQKLGKPINAILMTGDTSTNFIRNAENYDWPVLHKPVSASKLISSLSAQAQ